MKIALIYGTTGLIGSQLLTILLESDVYGEVKALTRRELGIQHDKLNEIIYDFDDPAPDQLKADHVFCCMGTTMKKAGNTRRYRKIDHDFVVETAQQAFQQGAELFSLVSAIGANPDSKIFYNRLKGEVEESIQKIGYKSLHIYRPSILLGKRREFRLMERFAQHVMRFFQFIIPLKHRGVPASKVAEVMATYASLYTKEHRIVSNKEIIRFNNKQS